MRNRTSLALVALLALITPAASLASSPSIATLDSNARASGNRKDIAEKIGDQLFAIEWPAQIMKVSANQAAGSLVVGLKVNGVHFHAPLTRDAFASEIVTIAGRIFATDPSVSEVDIWAAVPITVGKGVIVSGDLATPTTRDVFTVTIQRREAEAALIGRIKAGKGVYWDEEWVRTNLKQGA